MDGRNLILENKNNIIKMFFIHYCLPYNQIYFEDIIKKLDQNNNDDDFFVNKELFNLQSQQEIKNFAFNIDFICDKNNSLNIENCSPELILKFAILLNKRTFNNINKFIDVAGILRTKKDMIVLTDEINNKNKSEPPILIDYNGLIKDISSILSIPKYKLSKIILLSSYLLKNQLFFNGNKRTTFLLTNLLLISNNLGPYFDLILSDQQTSLSSSKRLLDEWNLIPYINNIFKKYKGNKKHFNKQIKDDILNFRQSYKFINGAEFNYFLNRNKEQILKYMEKMEEKNNEYDEEITSLYKIQ
ncbi:hypothetical protein [Mycoplasma elephantis]|uniref:hypothetical protein n=1 Tax=Mycoplasma elephantis TaxID=114882 RepID=UPI0004828FE6|nr:hypothetical protein [Mycoplasma elephantis]